MPAERSARAAFASHELQDETLHRMATATAYNRWLLDRSRPYLGARVLDAGAGMGTFTELLLPGRHAVVAVEPDPAFAALLRRRFRGEPSVVVVERELGELEDGSPPEPVDAIVCFNVLEHVQDDLGALRALYDRLAPGGRLLLLVPAHPALYGSLDRAVGHVRRYRKREVDRLLAEAGYAVEVLRLVNPLGVVGWLVAARIRKSDRIPERALRLYDRLVPALRVLDRVELPVGLSVWAVARRA